MDGLPNDKAEPEVAYVGIPYRCNLEIRGKPRRYWRRM